MFLLPLPVLAAISTTESLSLKKSLKMSVCLRVRRTDLAFSLSSRRFRDAFSTIRQMIRRNLETVTGETSSKSPTS